MAERPLAEVIKGLRERMRGAFCVVVNVDVLARLLDAAARADAAEAELARLRALLAKPSKEMIEEAAIIAFGQEIGDRDEWETEDSDVQRDFRLRARDMLRGAGRVALEDGVSSDAL